MATGGEPSTNKADVAPAATTTAAAANGDGPAPAAVPKTKFAVYCGASSGHGPEHLAMARELARVMHKYDIGLGALLFYPFRFFFFSFCRFSLVPPSPCSWNDAGANKRETVYGGGTVGMMGELAKTLVELSGPDAVHGVIP
jgi:predicted Rossmann-fold nucleotide-binding protein